ncbi:MAG: hypothetical protein KJI71_02680 [Patescibacteria group bacterium]|nr:hypothetical protein [Patescibacteria group bacterium]
MSGAKKENIKKKILLFSRDRGGSNVIIPLIQPLKSMDYNVFLFGKDVALKNYHQRGFQGEDITSVTSIINVDNLTRFLMKENFDFIITSTSGDDYTERYLWKAAKIIKIPSFGILDNWINYGLRFSEYDQPRLEEYNLSKNHVYLPTKILVMDQYAKENMLKEGFENSRILISGQPNFDYIYSKRKSYSEKTIQEFRREIGCEKEEVLITYISEGIAKSYNENNPKKHYWGFTERSILINLINVLTKICQLLNLKIKLLIKLHPSSEDLNVFNEILKSNKANLSFIVRREINSFLVMASSRVICGMFSMFLVESFIFGCPILSILIGLKRENPFILDKKKIVKSILNEENLYDNLKDLILKNNFQLNNQIFQIGATEKVIEYMEEILR